MANPLLNPFGVKEQRDYQFLQNNQTALPQSPPPPQVAVTGGNSPVLTQPPISTKPNEINPNTGQLLTAPPRVTGGNGQVLTTTTMPPNLIKPNQIDPVTGQIIGTGNSGNSGAVTGGNLPPQTQPWQTGGAVTGGNAQQILGYNPNGTPVYASSMAPAQVIQDITNQLLDPNGAYIQNARQRGLETASRRGLGNSSIAAGASQRAALDAVQPLVSEASNIFNRREQNAFDAEQTTRQQIFTALENQRDRDQQITMSQVQNWLNDQTFQREFNAQLSLLPISSAANLSQMLVQYAMEKPEVWTPDVIDGVSNFFNQSFLNMLQQYFPQYYGGGGG